MTEQLRTKIWISRDGEQLPVVFENIFQRETDQLVVSAQSNWVDLMLKLVQSNDGQYVVNYQRQETEVDETYQSEILTFEQLTSLILPFIDLLELSPYHNFEIVNQSSSFKVVLDEHNLLYVFGKTEECEKFLEGLGFSEGDITIPFPHVHLHSDQFSEVEEELIGKLEFRPE